MHTILIINKNTLYEFIKKENKQNVGYEEVH